MRIRAAFLPLLAAALAASLVACNNSATPSAAPAEVHWTEDYPAALAQAKKENKLLLLNFTGSDWCVPCQLLDRTVFTSPDFQKWAAGQFVFVTLDFPSRTPQADDLKARNKALKEQFKVEGYPTILIVDANEKERGRTLGFDEAQTAQTWLTDVQSQLAKSK